MKRFFSIFFIVSLLFINSCTTVPFTGRSSLSLVSDESLHATAAREYNKVKLNKPLIKSGSDKAMLDKVFRRLIKATALYYNQHYPNEAVHKYNWELILIKDDKMQNAFCMPGGKVAFFTGILPYTKNESGAAVVMAHEIAHALAKHSAERMSQHILGGIAVATAAAATDSSGQTQLYSGLFALGVLLPNSRQNESEADHIGLILMRLAGYNLNEAARFWERMSKIPGGSKSIGLLSTHPSHKTRIADIKKDIPLIKEKYRQIIR